MRIFEILIAIGAVAALLVFVRSPRRFARWSLGLSLASLGLLLLHLRLEGYRWQLLPLYLLVGLVLLGAAFVVVRGGPRLSRRWKVALAALGLALLISGVGLAIIFPIPDLPTPTGPYAVGTMTFHVIDDVREEIYTADPNDRREVMVQFWYPAAADVSGPTSHFVDRLDIAGPAIARRLELPTFLLDHVNLVQTHAIQDAPLAVGTFPVLVFSHGLRGLRQQNTILMEELASHGYVVAAVDHTYGNILTVFPDGRVAFFNGDAVFPTGETTVAGGARLVDVWVADIAYLLSQMELWNRQLGHPFQGKLDIARVGTLGHSTGGGAAIEACAQLPTCQGAAGLDAWIQPVDADLLVDYPHRLLLLSAPEWLGAANRADGERLVETSNATFLMVQGAKHFDFSDLPSLSPLTPALGLSGSIDSRQMSRIINAYIVAFFERIIRNEATPLLDAPSAAFPEVQFGPNSRDLDE